MVLTVQFIPVWKIPSRQSLEAKIEWVGSECDILTIVFVMEKTGVLTLLCVPHNNVKTPVFAMPILNLEPLWLSSIRTKMYLLAWEGWAGCAEDKASKENHRASENPDSKGGQCKSFTAHCTADTLQTPLAEAVPVKRNQTTRKQLSCSASVTECFSWPAGYVWYCIQLI